MNASLLNRALGSLKQGSFARAENERLIRSLHPTSDRVFAYKHEDKTGQDAIIESLAHPAGVNSITIDKFESRYLLSGGADASIAVWDLESMTATDGEITRFHPLGYATKQDQAHGAGVTCLTFFPFDSMAFASSSYDHFLRLYSSETLTCSASFDLTSVIYQHAMSPVASHMLTACATQQPTVRLVDLKSGASTHALAGHGGAVMSVAWHPSQENILVSGSTDGSVRVWDIRKSASSLGSLDMDDSIGVVASDDILVANRHQRGKAHTAAVNGVLWTDNGNYIITCGRDEMTRVWNSRSGANTLVNFGPTLKNHHGSTLSPCLTPLNLTADSNQMMIHPNPRELLLFELHTGTLVSKLRTASNMTVRPGFIAGSGTRNVLNRTTSLAWRPQAIELYSAHTDGTIRCWKPQTPEDIAVQEDSDDEGDKDIQGKDMERKRKREELDDLVRGLTKKQVTFI